MDFPAHVKFKTSINGPSFKVLSTTPPGTCDPAGVAKGNSCLLPIEFNPISAGSHGDVLTFTPVVGPSTQIKLTGALGSDSATPPVSGNLYVLDLGNNRVQIFNSDGVYQRQFSSSIMDDPTGIAVSSSNVFVNAGNDSCQVNVFDGTGDSLLQFGLCNGAGPGYLEIGGASAIDGLGNVWVTNQDGNIQQFDSSGNLLSIFCTSRLEAQDLPGCPLASGLGPDIYPQTIALDGSGNIYLASGIVDGPLIAKFDKTGKCLLYFGAAGSGDGELNNPGEIAVRSNGDIYVADSGNNRIEIFSDHGKYVNQFGKLGSSDTEFKYPQGIAFDAAGYLYVADTNNNRIVKYDSSGQFISTFGTLGLGNGQFYGPVAIVQAP